MLKKFNNHNDYFFISLNFIIFLVCFFPGVTGILSLLDQRLMTNYAHSNYYLSNFFYPIKQETHH